MRSFSSVLFLLTTLAAFAPAISGSAQESSEAEARSLFEQARSAAREGRLGDARDLFRQSLRAFPTAATAFNLARTLHDTGEYVEAGTLEDELLSGEYGEVEGERRIEVERLRAESRSRVGSIGITVFGNGRMDVRLDGRRIGRVLDGETIAEAVDPGQHLVSVTSPDLSLEGSQEVNVESGQSVEVELRLASTSDLETREPAAAEQEDSGFPFGWLIAGAVVLVAGGAVAMYFALQDPTLPDEFIGETEALRVSF